MKIEISPGTYTNTVNGVTRAVPNSAQDDFLYMNWEEDKKEFSVGMPGGKNYTVSRKNDSEESVYLVTEYYRDRRIKEIEVDVNSVNVHSASFSEMLALSVYTDEVGATKDFRFNIGSALGYMSGNENEGMYTDIKYDYYKALQELMKGNMRSDSYQYYLSLKSFFDYYDKEDRGVPSLLL